MVFRHVRRDARIRRFNFKDRQAIISFRDSKKICVISFITSIIQCVYGDAF